MMVARSVSANREDTHEILLESGSSSNVIWTSCKGETGRDGSFKSNCNCKNAWDLMSLISQKNGG